MSEIENNKMLIFGGTGSLGNKLVEKYIKNNKLYVYSRDEDKHWNMKIKFNNNENLEFIIGDVINENKISKTIIRIDPDIIIIASAMKHVDYCELNVDECINTNLLGIKNILNAIEVNNKSLNLKTVVFISTDKACSPINTYGMAKAISEQLMIEKSVLIPNKKFVCVRYGNVLNSRGSIIPLLHKLGNDPTIDNFLLTDENMTRFVMTLEESVNLIEHAIIDGDSGDIIVSELISMKVKDLLEIFSEKYNKPIINVGIRPGEKLLESLINETQSLRLVKKEKYYYIKSIFYCKKNKIQPNEIKDYNSKINPLTKEELKIYLNNLNLL